MNLHNQHNLNWYKMLETVQLPCFTSIVFQVSFPIVVLHIILGSAVLIQVIRDLGLKTKSGYVKKMNSTVGGSFKCSIDQLLVTGLQAAGPMEKTWNGECCGIGNLVRRQIRLMIHCFLLLSHWV